MIERPSYLDDRDWRAFRDAREGPPHAEREFSKLAALACPPASEPLPLAPPTPPPRPYPVAALGPTLSGAAESIAMRCQCSSALAAQGILAVASLASQRLADVCLPYGQTRPISLFFVTIAASGDRKSTVDNEALIPVRIHEEISSRSTKPPTVRGEFHIPHGLPNIGKLRTTGA